MDVASQLAFYNTRNLAFINTHIGIGTRGTKQPWPPDFTWYDFSHLQIMYLNLTILYNELVYYLHTNLLLSDTINSYWPPPDILGFLCLWHKDIWLKIDHFKKYLDFRLPRHQLTLVLMHYCIQKLQNDHHLTIFR